MQEEAERKNKGYRCIVYCYHPITQDELRQCIDSCTASCHHMNGCMHKDTPASSSHTPMNDDVIIENPDTAAVPLKQEGPLHCGLQINQKTPLRVLHRRSLLNRPRVIHSLHTTYLTPHYFILDLVTTAGTYVKEFVHGDLGRTVPNVGSLLKCKTHILQLDVIHLYDQFPGHDS